MNFANELRNCMQSDLIETEARQKNHVAERDFIEHLLELIKSECKTEAFKRQNMLDCYLYRNVDHEYRLSNTAINSMSRLCGGFFGTHRNLIEYEYKEDTDFIVSELIKRLELLGFAKVEVNLSYTNKEETIHKWKDTFWGTKRIEQVKVYPNYYTHLHIQLCW